MNNASIFEQDDIASATRESWDRHMGSNLRAPFVLTQAMAGQGLTPIPTRGRAACQRFDRQHAGSAGAQPDAGIHHLYDRQDGPMGDDAHQCAGAGPAIRVNGIGPGPTLQGPHQDPEDFAAQRRGTVLAAARIPRISRRHWGISSICRGSRGSLSAPMAESICNGKQALKAHETDVHAGSFARP